MRGIIVVGTNGSVVFHTAPCSRHFVDSCVGAVESDVHTRAAFDGAGAGGGAGGLSSAHPMGPSTTPGHITNSSFAPSVAAAAGGTAAGPRRFFQLSAQSGRAPVAGSQGDGELIASTMRHGTAATQHRRWLGADHKAVVEGVVTLCADEHPWIVPTPAAPTAPSPVTKEANSTAPTGARAVSLAPEAEEMVVLYWRKVGDKLFIFALRESENLALAKHAMSMLIVGLAEAFRGGSELPTLKDMAGKPEWIQAVCNTVAPEHVLVTVDVHMVRQQLSKQLKGK